MVTPLKFRDFTDHEHGTWAHLFAKQAPKRDEQIYSLFSRGLRELAMESNRVPDLDSINDKLERKTGFKGIPVEGLEEDRSFYEMLANRRFPIGNFIRDRKDLSYTPAPDVFHDLYGHLPFFVDQEYADFNAELGRRAIAHPDRPEVLTQFARLFWFTIEFALVKTPKGKRIFGAGIASSFGECAYALSDEPEVVPFDIDLIRKQDFRVDDFQRKLFILDSPEQLYSCLPEFERKALQGL